MNASAHQFLVLVLSFLMALPSPVIAQFTSADDPAKRYKTDMARLGKIMAVARDLRTTLNRKAFDFEAVLDASDYEAEQLIQFVKESITFDLYTGVLRGPQGALMGRAGNSVDQAALLAKLLNDAGFEARIAYAKLDDEDAREVLKAVGRTRAFPAPLADADSMIATYEKHGLLNGVSAVEKQKLAAQLNDPPDPRASQVHEQVVEVARFISNSLDEGNQVLGVSPTEQELLSEAREYFWVQYRDSAAGGWVNAHPLSKQDQAFIQPEPESFYVDTLPLELQHRLRVEAFIERKTGNKLEVVPIMSAWERPVANLQGKPLTFANITDTMMSGDSTVLDLHHAVDGASYFAPGFDGGMAPGAQLFDANGSLIDPMALSGAAAGIIKEVNRSFRDALGALGDESSLPILTAQWLKFTLIEPGGRENSFTRTTIDRIGPAARAAGHPPENLRPATAQQLRALLKRHTFMLHAGKIPRGFAIESAAQQMLDSRPAIEAVIRKAHGLPPQSPASVGAASELSADWYGHLQLFTYFDQTSRLSKTHHVYRPAPALVIQSEGLAEDAGFAAVIDIVNNPLRALNISNEIPVADPSVMLEAGVWETATEGVLLSKSGENRNTFTVMDKARSQDNEFVLLTSATELHRLGAPDDVRAAIQHDLETGYAVLSPAQIANPDEAGWWRVDLSSGQTLGQYGDGRGAEVTEYLLLGITLGFVAYGTLGCAESGSELISCCTASVAGFAVAGLALGAAVAAGGATTSVAAGTAVGFDLSTGVPGGFGTFGQKVCERIVADG